MAYLLYLMIALTAGLIIYWIIAGAPGRHLASDIASLEPLKGKTSKEIIRVAGPPTSSSTLTDGGQLLEWRTKGHHIALLFDTNRICQGQSNRPPSKPDVAKTGPTPVQPKVALKESPPATLEKHSTSAPKEGTIAKTPTDFRQSTTTPAQTQTAKPLDRSPLVAIRNQSKDTAIQTAIGKTTIDYLQPTMTPTRSIPRTPIVGAQNDFIPPSTGPKESLPQESLIILCDNCGSSFKADAKYCDSCGEAATQQASISRKDEQPPQPSDSQGIMHVIEPAVGMTARDQRAIVSCEYCGRELKAEDKFCDRCGTLIQMNYA